MLRSTAPLPECRLRSELGAAAMSQGMKDDVQADALEHWAGCPSPERQALWSNTLLKRTRVTTTDASPERADLSEAFATPGLRNVRAAVMNATNAAADEVPGVQPPIIHHGGRGGRVTRASQTGPSLTVRIDGIRWSLFVLVMGLFWGGVLVYIALSWAVSNEALTLLSAGNGMPRRERNTNFELTDGW
ncbi:hypothetical protein BKA70DRAFT_1238516 [Coprinopsis sp. MPI-PUGE-AT-0042]|nr:hypothetical protein BKA70DRAFT_1238516 [Coprinopsis sp. MPI-PUGE-AT-0042]